MTFKLPSCSCKTSISPGSPTTLHHRHEALSPWQSQTCLTHPQHAASQAGPSPPVTGALVCRAASRPLMPWLTMALPMDAQLLSMGLPLHRGADLSGPQAQRGLPLHPGADLSRPQAQRVLPLHPWEGLSRPQAQRGLPLHPWRFGSGSPCTLLTSGFKAQTHWKHSVPTS